jgi:hypothetical protein
MIKLRIYGGQGTLVYVGERTNAALVGKCEGERQFRRPGTWVSNLFWEWATPVIVA